MKIKLWVSMVLAFLAFIFITQNTAMVDVKFIVWSVEMSLVLLVFLMLGAGVIIGWLLNSYVRFAGKKRKEQKAAESAARPPDPVAQDINEAAIKAKTAIREEKEKL